jgi:hypothetical protein
LGDHGSPDVENPNPAGRIIMTPGEITLEYTPTRRDSVVIVAVKQDNAVLESQELNVLKPEQRDRFLERLCRSRPGIDRKTVENLLMQIAEKSRKFLDSPATQNQTIEQILEGEIDTSFIVRPERFITAEVSGMAFPIMRRLAGKLQGQWVLYLQWSDGKRQAIPLKKELTLSGDKKIWFHPIPTDPTDASSPAWSTDSREQWLAGEQSPDPAGLFKTLCEVIQYYLDFPADHAPGATALLALWVILTYNYPVWEAIPYLYLGGPLGSGKTRLMDILSLMAFRPVTSSNLTAPALFRTLHQDGGTLFYDEAEKLKQITPDTGELLSMLLAGYKRGGKAIRLEPVGDSFRTVKFQVYGPKVLACITGLPPALSSRCITLTMFRANPNSVKPRRRIDEHSHRWQKIRDELHRLAISQGAIWLKLAENTRVCPEMTGRNYELWQPILSLADWVEQTGAAGLLALIQQFAKTLMDSTGEEEIPVADEIVLQYLTRLIRIGEQPQPRDILDRVRESNPETFSKYTAKGIANLLKRYGVKTNKTRGTRVYSHITLSQLEQIERNYGFDLGIHQEDEVLSMEVT